MKKLIFILLLATTTFFSKAQNLVPNWSFEDTVSCPTGGNQVHMAQGWSSYRSSPDYCHACNTYFQSVPFNQWGYQYPKTGDAYAGLITYINFVPDAREYIGIQLLQPLIVGTEYFISFYVAMAYNMETQLFGIATNNVGLKFSTVELSASNPAPVNNYAHIHTTSIITDTLNWTKISGSFIADSAYSYVIIGNLFTDSLTSIIYLDSTAKWSYYYIDDIRISSDSAFVNNIENYISPYIINAFPNPARDWLKIEGSDISAIFLFDVLGKIVYEEHSFVTPLHKISVLALPAGVYFLSVKVKNNIIRKK